MSRGAIACLAIAGMGLGCGRAQGIDDKDLGNLVVAPAVSTEAIVVARAATEPAELSRALMQPDRFGVEAGLALLSCRPGSKVLMRRQAVLEAGTRPAATPRF